MEANVDGHGSKRAKIIATAPLATAPLVTTVTAPSAKVTVLPVVTLPTAPPTVVATVSAASTTNVTVAAAASTTASFAFTSPVVPTKRPEDAQSMPKKQCLRTITQLLLANKICRGPDVEVAFVAAAMLEIMVKFTAALVHRTNFFMIASNVFTGLAPLNASVMAAVGDMIIHGNMDVTGLRRINPVTGHVAGVQDFSSGNAAVHDGLIVQVLANFLAQQPPSNFGKKTADAFADLGTETRMAAAVVFCKMLQKLAPKLRMDMASLPLLTQNNTMTTIRGSMRHVFGSAFDL
jgi:hypothetical protein